MHGSGRWRAAVLVAAMAWVPGTAPAAPFRDPGAGTPSALDALADSVLGPGVAAAGSPRVVLGLSLHGQRRYRAYGGNGQPPLEPGSIVEIGSITKVFTTVLLAEAIDAGTVDPDRSIGTYLPGVPLRPCTARITPTELADFTSGLPELPDDVPRALERRGLRDYTPADFLRWLSRTAPDTGCDLPAPYLYSNASVGLLGPILFHATGRPWRELVSDGITGPLGMTDTAIDPPRFDRVQGHRRDGSPAPPWPVFAWFAAGALRSTAADMLDFGEAALGHPQVNGAPVPAELSAAFRRAMRPIYQPPGRFFSMGLAWASAPDGSGGTMVYKDGGTDGFTTVLVVDPSRDCTVFLAADHAGVDMQRLGLTLMRAIGHAPIHP